MLDMVATLPGGSTQPLYQQVANAVRASIDGGVYLVGHKIPTEPELSQLYGVSRITVRKAVEQLVGEGRLVKYQGRGTFVREPGPRQVICDDVTEGVCGFSESCRAEGMVPGARTLRCEVVPAQEGTDDFFGGAARDGIIAIERLRTADGQPIMYERNRLPYLGLEFLMEQSLEDVSLFETIACRTGRIVRKNVARSLSIQLADDELSRILSVPVGEPLFYLTGRYHDQHGAPLYIGDQYIIGSRYTFSM